MNRSARSVLRRINQDPDADASQQGQFEHNPQEGQQQSSSQKRNDELDPVPDEIKTESEKRHENYRRRQAMAGRFTPAVERLPIMTADERAERDKNRPKWRTTTFEGPIEKLIEKYQDLEEVQRHLTLGQSMKYDFTEDGQVLDKNGVVIFDGEKLVNP